MKQFSHLSWAAWDEIKIFMLFIFILRSISIDSILFIAFLVGILFSRATPAVILSISWITQVSSWFYHLADATSCEPHYRA